ncbi:MAG: hypothetical protein M3Z97_09945 [Candidatus Dormibacteraeota bacterium]|jgi:hypothetical protein|nr:hypothetical protein [Candidatus Dormibacteraeota bacterium]
MGLVNGSRRSRGGLRLGPLMLLGLLGIAVMAAINAKDIERYLKLRNM